MHGIYNIKFVIRKFLISVNTTWRADETWLGATGMLFNIWSWITYILQRTRHVRSPERNNKMAGARILYLALSLMAETREPLGSDMQCLRRLRFSQRCCWGFRSSGMWHCVVMWLAPDVSTCRITFSIKHQAIKNLKMETVLTFEISETN
jgi:hypothetical protein